MKNWRIALYMVVGAAFGALAGAIAVVGPETATRAPMEVANLLRLGLMGAILALPGGIVEKSVRKSLVSALAGALGLIIIILFLLRIVQMDLSARVTIALALLMSCAFGALLAVMHALLDERYKSISYSVIMGANGGLAGTALAFLGANLLGWGRIDTVLIFTLYSATIWAAIAVARKLELFEQETQALEGGPPAPSP